MIKALLAALSNILFPGLGFIQSGKNKYFWIFYIGFLSTLLGVKLLAFHQFILYFLFVIAIGLWLWVIVDSFIMAFRYNPNEKNKVRWYVYVILFVCQVSMGLFIQSSFRNSFSNVELFSVSSPNMSPTLRVGELVSAKRTKKISRNDLIVFKFPLEQSTHYLKRCIGMPGDSLTILHGQVYINNQFLPHDCTLQFRYFVISDDIINDRVFNKCHIDEFYPERGGYRIFASEAQVEELRKLSMVKEVKLWMMPENEPERGCFPSDLKTNWNSDHYGPLYIPAKGATIEINNETLHCYKDVIINHEGWADVKIINDQLFIDSDLIETYTFRQNYYFSLGDSRHNSLDSRYWGFIPEHLVFGKLIYRYWSDDWHRIGKI